MVTDIFTQGTLHMATSPVEGLDTALLWREVLTNRILVVLSVLLFIINIKDLFRLASPLAYSMSRTRGSAALEYNASNARIRNLTALFSVLPFCLIMDRFEIFRPQIWSLIPSEYSVPALVAVVFAFLVVRRICFFIFKPGRVRYDEEGTLQHSIYDYFIVLTIVLLVTVGVLGLFELADQVLRTIILLETGVFYLTSLMRTSQILNMHCSGFTTFLYLCALELLPTAMLIACALIF